MKMENENIKGEEVLESIRETRKLFHSKAHFPNAILINPVYYSALEKVLDHANPAINKKIFDLTIFVTEDTSSFEMIRVYDSHECSI
jgi:hypothetical protein